METLVINIPNKKSALVKQLLKELGVTIDTDAVVEHRKIPNELTVRAIEDAHNGIDLDGPIKDIKSFVKSL
jgi:hypothetical protein